MKKRVVVLFASCLVAFMTGLSPLGCSAIGTVSGDGGNDGLDADLDGNGGDQEDGNGGDPEDGGDGDSQDPCSVEVIPPVCDQEVVISEKTNVTENTVYPEGTCVRFDGEGALELAAGVTVTFQGPIIAPLRTIFSGAGRVTAMEVYPQWFGAKCDGATDDTEAIQRSFASAPVIRPKDGICMIRDLILPESRQILGDNATFLNVDLDATALYQYSLLTLNSKSVVKNLRLDGRSRSVIGMEIAPSATGVKISCCQIENLKGNAGSPVYGVWIRAGDADITVSDSTIRHLSGGSDGVIGNSIGANRGILISGEVSNTLIERCIIDDIGDAEDGDAIQVQSTGLNPYPNPYPPSYVTIRNCTLTEFQKRAVKLQSSNVTVEGNTISSTFADCASCSDDNGDGVQAGIELYGENHVVRDNRITLTRGIVGIGVVYAKNIEIRGNQVSVDTVEVYETARGSTWAFRGIELFEKRDAQGIITDVNERVTIVGNSIEAHRYPIRGYVCNSTISDNAIVKHDLDSDVRECTCDPVVACP
jgi:hypothetical protein